MVIILPTWLPPHVTPVHYKHIMSTSAGGRGFSNDQFRVPTVSVLLLSLNQNLFWVAPSCDKCRFRAELLPLQRQSNARIRSFIFLQHSGFCNISIVTFLFIPPGMPRKTKMNRNCISPVLFNIVKRKCSCLQQQRRWDLYKRIRPVLVGNHYGRNGKRHE